MAKCESFRNRWLKYPILKWRPHNKTFFNFKNRNPLYLKEKYI